MSRTGARTPLGYKERVPTTLKPIEACGLYTFVDTGCLGGREPEDIARALCDGGADLVQVRAKRATPDAVRSMAERLLPITQAAGVWLVINDHPSVAFQVGAPLCHLGQEDFFDAGYTHVSQIGFGPSASVEPTGQNPTSPAAEPEVLETGERERRPLIGLSTHAPAQAERAIAAGAAYVAIGPVFATPTKPGRPPVTLDYVRWAAANVRIPWFAIGGITLDNLDAVLAAGARRVCVVRAVLDTPDVARACREFARRLGSAGS